MSDAARIRVHRIAFSTNVERVALAAAHKGVPVEWVDVDPADRSAVVALSGQDLVPVMETPEGAVVADSMAIVEWLESHVARPALWPPDACSRARADIAVEWFNGVWKAPPNAIADALAGEQPDQLRIATWSAQLGAWLTRFEVLLGGRDFLLGDRLGVFDVCAFPFLKYGVIVPARDDPDPFHHVLHEHQRQAADLPLLSAWIARVDALPRA